MRKQKERDNRWPFADSEFTPDWPYDGARRYDIIVAMRRALREADAVGFRNEPLPRTADGCLTDEVRERLARQMAARREIHKSWDLRHNKAAR